MGRYREAEKTAKRKIIANIQYTIIHHLKWKEKEAKNRFIRIQCTLFLVQYISSTVAGCSLSCRFLRIVTAMVVVNDIQPIPCIFHIHICVKRCSLAFFSSVFFLVFFLISFLNYFCLVCGFYSSCLFHSALLNSHSISFTPFFWN